MLVLGITIDSPDPLEVQASIAYHLRGLVQSNRLIMRREHIPPIYSSGVLYMPEVWAAEMQSVSNCREAWHRGWVECKGAAAWLCAQHIEATGDERFDLEVDSKDRPTDPLGVGLLPRDGVVRVWHVRVRHPSGKLEDPSLKLRRR